MSSRLIAFPTAFFLAGFAVTASIPSTVVAANWIVEADNADCTDALVS